MDDNMIKGFAALAGLALVGTVGTGAIVASNSAANDLRPRAVKALTEAGLADVVVDFAGREATLSGGAPSERNKAVSIVEDIAGVRWARFTGTSSTATAVPAAASGPMLKFSRSDIGATIGGVVPSAEVAADLKSAAAETFGGTASGDFRVDPSVGSADWLTALPEVFGDLSGVKNLEIGIRGDDQIQLRGSIESQAGVDRVNRLVSAALPGLTVDSTITVDSGQLDSDDAETLNSTTIYFGRGSAALSAADTAALDLVADILARNAGLEVEAAGHAGPTDPVKGRVLSDARVAAVKSYLVGAGVQADRIATKSFGSDDDTTADAFAKQYRRVDFAVGAGN